MPPSQCRCCALLLALVLGCALSVSAGKWGASYQDTVELETGRFMYQPPAPSLNHRCHWSCTGEDGVLKDSGDVNAPPEAIDCWGEFRFWCRAGPPGPHAATAAEVLDGAVEPQWPRNATVRFWGTSCRGHFFSAPAPTPTPPGAPGAGVTRRLVVCEGGQRVISGRVSTCPHTGDTYKSMTGSWSLGASVAMMSAPQRPQPAAHEDRSSAASPSDEAAAWMQRLGDNDELAQALAVRAPAAASAALHLGANSSSGLHLEVRGEGLSGRWRATRKLGPREALGLGQEEAEEEVEDILAPSWRDWLPHWWSGSDRPHGGGTFELLCNGRPAWLHGAAPCWGNFSLLAEHSCGPDANSSTVAHAATGTATEPSQSLHSSTHHTLRRSLLKAAAQEDKKDDRGVLLLPEARAVAGSRYAGSATAAGHVKAGASGSKTVSHEAVTSRMTAECDGLWTGALGHTCYGLNIANSVARGASGWSSDKWSICSGHSTVRFIKRRDVWGMGTTCKGKALEHVHLQWPAPTPTPSV